MPSTAGVTQANKAIITASEHKEDLHENCEPESPERQ